MCHPCGVSTRSVIFVICSSSPFAGGTNVGIGNDTVTDTEDEDIMVAGA